ncbi:endosomal/lysosomal proton channel TMEM175 isoform X1 [Latimeria chalumnae]|uniref:endosomal/lysosomal proton channel TMEM175 isoform X1 n=2 Tax=Latimeria chalumnae TaxID=7897 RepID=UPI0006D9106C|nr:PREDICTED: endosomal/lysomomal potassium channel TMEM175 [Latimeria chalumnae]|eukprot:XP_014350140.1 PREDICTED: endosomal/lysomomal potassium channel TMEM175 [Latimeria chalumnae]
MSFADTEEIVEHHLSEEMEKGPEGTCRPSLLENEGASRTQSSHRLLAYSDALISIIATVMILPVSHTKIHPDQELEESIQQLLATKIAVYLMTFLIVTVAWAAHIRLFQVIEHIDDFLALLNLACMMLITFLPYTFSLMASFPDVPLGILLFCVCAIIIGLIQAAIVMYGFSKPYLLNCQIQISENQAFYKHHILKIILRAPALCFLAGVFSFFFFPLSYVFLVLVVVLPYITRLIQWCRGTKYSSREKESSDLKFYTYHHNEPFSKERVEAFSDGVYAIVATLLILDICEDNVPDPKEVKEKFHGSLVEALRSYGPEFLAYFGSFVTVGLLWFVHHSLFLHVTKPTRLMGLLNTFSLAFIGGLPLAYQLTHNFAKRSRNELEAIQVSCIIIFFASIFQFAIWTAALFNEKETLHPHARYGGHEHAFMFVKLSLYPCVSLVTFFLTCFLSKFSTAIFHLMEIIVPFAFLMLRIIVKIALMLIRMLFCPTTPKHTMLEEETRFPITESIS